MNVTRASLAFAAALLVAVPPTSFAQQPDSYQQDTSQVDPPSRVARLSILNGNVSLQSAGVNDFAQAELNYPLTSGDRLYADPTGRAELQIGQLTVRLGAQSDFTLTALTDTVAQFGLAQGSVHLRPYALDADTVTELDTPNASITVMQPGDLRVDVYPQDNITILTVLSGQAQVNADGVNQLVQGGQALQIGGLNGVPAQFVGRARPDALDQFSAQRDAQYQQEFAAESQYVDPATIGSSDLGQYGDWSNDGDSGPVWYPRGVAADWAPYSVGHWAYIAPWGWTWVEAEPWGFAPFHYGRWARFGPRWGWIPGPPVVHPVYSPALVVFVGGPRFSLSIGVGGGGGGVAAWFPLGPREVYQPPYRTSTVYANRINVTNIYNRNTVEVRNIYNQRTTNVYVNNVTVNNNVYVNRTIATTAVPQDHFAAGRPVRGNQVQVDPTRLAQAPVAARPPSVAPQRPVAAGPPPQGAPPVQKRPELSNSGAAATAHPGFGPPRSSEGTRPGSVPPQPAPPQAVPAAPARPGYGPPRSSEGIRPAPPQSAPPQPAPQQASPVQPAPGMARPTHTPPTQVYVPAPAAAPAEVPQPGVRRGDFERPSEPRPEQPAVNPQSPYQPRPVQRPVEPAPQPRPQPQSAPQPRVPPAPAAAPAPQHAPQPAARPAPQRTPPPPPPKPDPKDEPKKPS